MSGMNEVTTARRPIHSLVTVLLLSSLISISLFGVRVLTTHSTRYWFLVWNVALAWLPLLLAVALGRGLSKRRWLSWQNSGLTLLWLAFLPNSFYLVSDLIHINSSTQSNLLFDVVLFSSFAFNGLCLGFGSLFLVHRYLLKRLAARTAHVLVAGVLLSSSFAIYLGRDLRWNTWDVLINPAGLVLNISDRLINPASHGHTFVTTATFFALLGSIYLVLWQFTGTIQPKLKS